MVDTAVEKFGGLHVAFNNAGTFSLRTFDEVTEESMSKLLDVNFKAVVFCFKYQVNTCLPLSSQGRANEIVRNKTVTFAPQTVPLEVCHV